MVTNRKGYFPKWYDYYELDKVHKYLHENGKTTWFCYTPYKGERVAGFEYYHDLMTLTWNPHKNTLVFSATTSRALSSGRVVRQGGVNTIIRLGPNFRVWIIGSAGKRKKRSLKDVTYKGSIYVSDVFLPVLKQFFPSELFEPLHYSTGVSQLDYGKLLFRNYREIFPEIKEVFKPLRAIVKQDRLRDAVKEMFGISGPSAIEFLKNFKGHPATLELPILLSRLIPFDIVSLMRYAPSVSFGNFIMAGPGLTLFKRWLRTIPQKFLIRLAHECRQHGIRDTIEYQFMDSFNSWKNIMEVAQRDNLPDPIPDVWNHDNWRQVHDYLLRKYRGVSNSQYSDQVLDREYKYDERHLAYLSLLETKDYAGYSIKFPRIYRDVYQWGEDMGHCIYTNYGRSHYDSVMLLGVYKEDKLCYNVMVKFVKTDKSIQFGSIVQFYGKYNAVPKERESVTAVLCLLPGVEDVDCWYPKILEPL